jgi:putative phage-type endonuclease
MDSIIDRIYAFYDKQIDNIENDNNKLFVINKIYDILVISIDDNITKNYIINRINIIINSKKKLEILKKLPVIEQRTDEWFNARKNMITASDMAQALNKGKFGNQKDFIIKKITNLINNENVYHKTDNPILLWGVRYEEVANKIYMKRNKIKTFEFGLIKHPNIDFFGASPDGISELGVMLEIKCPPKRKITGEIPEQYWMQMQGQLEVCNLDDCDYLECKFSEYKNESDFILDKDYDQILSSDLKEKGIMIQIDHNDETKYLYSDLNLTIDQMLDWKNNIISNLEITEEYTIYYWKLTEYFCKRVKRDVNFFEENIKNLEFLWNKIKFFSEEENKNEYLKNIINNNIKKGEIYNFKNNKNNKNVLSGFVFKQIKEDLI